MEIDRPSHFELKAARRVGGLVGEAGFHTKRLREGIGRVLFQLNPLAATWDQTKKSVENKGKNRLSNTPVMYQSTELKAESAKLWPGVGSGHIYWIYRLSTKILGLAHVDGDSSTPVDIRDL